MNVICKRAGIPAAGLWTNANLGGKSALDVVLSERKLELAWEGDRKFYFLTVEAKANEIIDFIPEQQITRRYGI